MKTIFLILLSSIFFTCSDSTTTNIETERPLSEREKRNTYSVNLDERRELKQYYDKLKEELKDLEFKLLVEASEDREMHLDYVGLKDRGVIRLTNGNYFTQHDGNYYSFFSNAHEYGYGSDISYNNDSFTVGFAGADYGFFTDLGFIDLDIITESDPQLKYMLSHKPSKTERIGSEFSDGFNSSGYIYKDSIEALNGKTYAVRSISYDTSDVLVAFQVIRRDEIDGSLILKWKLLRSFEPTKFEGQ